LPSLGEFHIKWRDLLHAANLRHGTDGFTSPPKEGMLWNFLPWKFRRLRPGSKPRTWVPEASMLTTRPPKPKCALKCVLKCLSVLWSVCWSVCLSVLWSVLKCLSVRWSVCWSVYVCFEVCVEGAKNKGSVRKWCRVFKESTTSVHDEGEVRRSRLCALSELQQHFFCLVGMWGGSERQKTVCRNGWNSWRWPSSTKACGSWTDDVTSALICMATVWRIGLASVQIFCRKKNLKNRCKFLYLTGLQFLDWLCVCVCVCVYFR
jgi:hypothetical protein